MTKNSVEKTTEILLELNNIAVEYNSQIADKVAGGVDDGYLETVEDMWEAAKSFYEGNIVEDKPFEVVLNIENEFVRSEGFYSTREEAHQAIDKLRSELTTTIYFGGWDIIEKR